MVSHVLQGKHSLDKVTDLEHNAFVARIIADHLLDLSLVKITNRDGLVVERLALHDLWQHRQDGHSVEVVVLFDSHDGDCRANLEQVILIDPDRLVSFLFESFSAFLGLV